MADFRNPVDIGNRALQRCGATRVNSLTEDSKNASEVAFCYDKLRRAELRRNPWRFSIKKAAIRPLSEDTRLFTGAAWAVGTSYTPGAVVLRNNKLWQTPVASTGEEPGADNTPWDSYAGTLTVEPWDSGTAYYAGELASNGGNVYLSLVSSNDDEPPAATWVLLGDQDDVSHAYSVLYPLGAGPVNQTGTLNVYHLPNSYLRMAPQGPKEGSSSWLGAPSGLQYSDWDLEGDFLTTRDERLIVLRFVADVTQVTSFDPMFCEGLACRIGLEVCEPLTQSSDKLGNIGAQYKLFMGEARTVNAIELGPTEPPEDDYIVCRL